MEILYDTRLVLLSMVVAILASYASLSLAARITHAPPAHARFWLAGGAVSMGTGIWSMHFVGMLAASLPIRMVYDVGYTMASLVIAIVVSGFALRLVSGATLPRPRLAGGGVSMGAGIATMHYVGMGALEISPAIRYEPGLFAASLLIAMVAAGAALWLAFELRSDSIETMFWKKTGSATIMGLAISGMHYTGMAAAQIAAGSVCTAAVDQPDNGWLGVTIGGAAFLLLATTLLLSVFDAHQAQRAARQATELEVANERLRRESGRLAHANLRLHVEIEQRRRAQAEIGRLNAELEGRVAQRTAQLQAVNRELEAFSYSIAHDLRAPLMAIDGFRAVLASRRNLPDDKRRHYFERIHASVQQMSELIDALLSLASISRSVLRWGPVDLGALARAAAERLHEIHPARNVRLHVQDGLTTEGDARLLKVVMENLIGNAWKFTSGQAVAEISVGRQTGTDCHVAYFVQDNGAGLDMAYVSKLFRSFQRLHKAEEFPGTGVGLANVQRILERHGGRIWVQAAPGLGATFYFSLGNRENVAVFEEPATTETV